jgi:hypothetical protein
MQTLEIVALGLLFSFIGTIAYLLLGLFFHGPVSRDQATGLGAVFGGLKDATVFNPLYRLGILLAFGTAYWLVRLLKRA